MASNSFIQQQKHLYRDALEIDACQLALAMRGLQYQRGETAKVEVAFVKESHMAQLLIAIGLSSLLLFGCSSNLGSAGLGAVGGAAAGAAGYEYNAHRQMQELEEDYKAGRIDREEYAARKNQIQKGSILK
jgi:hypothetical protein